MNAETDRSGSHPDEEIVLQTTPDPAITEPGLSASEKKQIAKQVIDHIQRHAQAHGGFSGFADFLTQCDQIILKTRAKRCKPAVTLANSLARDVSSIREASDELPPQMKALLYRGITTGFLYANLKREITDARHKRVQRFSRDDYIAALGKHPKNRALLARSLHVSLPVLTQWEKKHRR